MKKVISVFILLLTLSKPSVTDSETVAEEKSVMGANLSSMESYAIEVEIKFVDVFMAQVILESSYMQHEPCRKRNNFVNMKVPYKRYFFGINEGEYNQYAEYATWKDGVLDYKSWQKSNAYLIKTEEQYLDLLQKMFAEDKRYKKKLKQIIKNRRNARRT